MGIYCIQLLWMVYDNPRAYNMHTHFNWSHSKFFFLCCSPFAWYVFHPFFVSTNRKLYFDLILRMLCMFRLCRLNVRLLFSIYTHEKSIKVGSNEFDSWRVFFIFALWPLWHSGERSSSIKPVPRQQQQKKGKSIFSVYAEALNLSDAREAQSLLTLNPLHNTWINSRKTI